jgi:hypothetical protein
MKREKIMSTLEIRKLHAFGALVADYAARDLQLLGEIESTIEFLDIALLRTEQSNRSAEMLIEIVNQSDDDIDPSGRLNMVFEKTRDMIANIHGALVVAHQSALDDHRLNDEDGIADGCKRLINEFAELHNNLNTLAWAIGENSADHEKVISKSYTSVEEMFADMGV